MNNQDKREVDAAFATINDVVDGLYGFSSRGEQQQLEEIYESLKSIQDRLQTFLDN